jgi:undecaprenyl-phosphate galactose phosphotransferase/putative colanic acid biosynthesis UDP-glucose lipid carrier transferase
MPQGKSKLLPYIIFVIDSILLISSVIIVNKFRFNTITLPHHFYYYLVLGWFVIWLLVGLKFSLFEIPQIIYLDKVLYQNFKAFLVFIALSTTIVFFVTTFKFSRFYFVLFNVIFLIGILAWRLLFWIFFKKYRQNGHNYRKIILIGFNDNLCKILDKIYLNPNFGYRIEGLFTNENINSKYKKYYKGKLEDFFPFIKQGRVYEVVISLPHSKEELVNEILNYADNNLIRVKLVPEFSEYLSHVFSIDYVENIPIMRYRNEPLQSFFNRFMKRFFDFILSLIAVVFIMSWLYPIVGLIIILTSKGPILFKQERTGKDGLPFKCLKFRSMTMNGDSDKLQACKSDARITKVGAFLRKTSIDELPQLFNVLLNQMSLVGPRPHMTSHTEEYKQVINNFMVRHFAKPGLTGWAQIKGFRGETKTVQDMANRVNADIWYIENWNFMLDIKIIFLTIWIVLFKKEENAF